MTDRTQRRGHLRILIALALAAVVALLGGIARPQPPSLSTAVTGDGLLAAHARPLLAGALDRVSVAVIDGDTITYANFGATDETQYEIGSISKTFTALLFADAIARGEVRADTRLGDLLPVSGTPAGGVTLAELASHRSGLPRVAPTTIEENLLLLTHRSAYTHDVAGLVAVARGATLENPGQYVYSDLGVALLGQAIAAATRLDFPTLLRERVLGPLGMHGTSAPLTGSDLPPGAATGYDEGGQPQKAWAINAWAPAGGMRSTTADMARYAQALLRSTAPGMDALTPRWDDGDGSRVGYAWNTATFGGRTVTIHGGATSGFCSVIALDRTGHRAVIILSNTKVPVEHAALMLLAGGL